MQTLSKVLGQAETNKVGIGHFNVSDSVTLKAVFESARDQNVPVIVGVSEGERQFLGVCQIAALVKSLREEHDFPISLNADHTHTLSSAIEAAQAGFDWIVFDVSTLPFEENIRQTRTAVETLKAIRRRFLWKGRLATLAAGPRSTISRPTAQRLHDCSRSETVRGRNKNRHTGSGRRKPAWNDPEYGGRRHQETIGH